MQKHILILFFISSYLASINAYTQGVYTQAGAALYIVGNGGVDGAISASPTIFINGSIKNTGNLVNQGEIQLQGDLSNTGTFNSIGDKIFVGAAAQNMSENLINPNSLFNVVIDKTANPLSLNNHVEVNSQVYFVNGKISVGTNNLSLVPTATFLGQNINN